MQAINYEIISASGNPTAIIYGQYSRGQKEEINKKIFATNKLVEQIGYIYQKEGKPFFEMMGNEFSGNGCRSAGYSLLKYKNGVIKFATSGVKDKIIVKVNNNYTTASIPYLFTRRKMIKNKFGFLIKLFGSYIFVVKEEGSYNKAQRIVNEYKNKKAVGIMFIKDVSDNIIDLNPFFYVKDTKTLINETACGSGSTVAAIYLSRLRKQSFYNLEIKQPSKDSIFVTTNYQDEIIKNIKISGRTRLIGNYTVIGNI